MEGERGRAGVGADVSSPSAPLHFQTLHRRHVSFYVFFFSSSRKLEPLQFFFAFTKNEHERSLPGVNDSQINKRRRSSLWIVIWNTNCCLHAGNYIDPRGTFHLSPYKHHNNNISYMIFIIIEMWVLRREIFTSQFCFSTCRGSTCLDFPNTKIPLGIRCEAHFAREFSI